MLPDEGPGRGRGRDGDTSACTIYASDGGHVLRRTAVKLFIRFSSTWNRQISSAEGHDNQRDQRLNSTRSAPSGRLAVITSSRDIVL